MRNHYVPRFYLSGFSDAKGKVFLYRKSTDKVQYVYTKSAATETDFYSEELETHLAYKIEYPVVRLLNRLRNKQPMIADEKTIFAEYIINLMKRGLRGLAKYKQAKFVELAFESTRQWLLEIVKKKPHHRVYLETEYARLLTQKHDWLSNPPREFWHHALKKGTSPKAVAALTSMIWRFYVYDSPMFLTSDNPVCFDEHLGIGKAISTLYFPISSHIVLEASNLVTRDLQFFSADQRLLDRINRIIANASVDTVFHYEYVPWVREFVKSK